MSAILAIQGSAAPKLAGDWGVLLPQNGNDCCCSEPGWLILQGGGGGGEGGCSEPSLVIVQAGCGWDTRALLRQTTLHGQNDISKARG